MANFQLTFIVFINVIPKGTVKLEFFLCEMQLKNML